MSTQSIGIPELLTIEAVAGILNVKVARAYELARTGLIPTVKLGRQVRVEKSRLIAWIEDGGAALPGGWKKAP